MILFISNTGEALPVAYRLRREGIDAKVYVHNRRYRQNYAGVFNKVGLAKVKQTAKKADLVVFDMTRVNEKTKDDKALLGIFKAPKTSGTVFGPVADRIKAHTPVIGASTWTEELEMDRRNGADLAGKLGIRTPESRDFDKLSDGAAFLKGRKERWVFKPHNNQDLDLTYVEKYPGELCRKLKEEYPKRVGEKIPFMLQRVVEGVEISTEGWFDGERFVHFNHTLENKRLMNGNLGPAIGSQSNTVWIKEKDGLLVEELQGLKPYLKKAGYAGPVDVNCIVSEEDRQPYFLEWTPRFGFDALFCLLSMVDGPLSDFFLKRFDVPLRGAFASSERLTVPPFPYATRGLLDDFARDVPIEDGLDRQPLFWAQDVYQDGQDLKCAGADGILGVMASRGNTWGGSWGNVYRPLEKLRVGSYKQYRTDGANSLERRYNKLKKWGVPVD
jgi:phosphoribosylamine-glycine ligase